MMTKIGRTIPTRRPRWWDISLIRPTTTTTTTTKKLHVLLQKDWKDSTCGMIQSSMRKSSPFGVMTMLVKMTSSLASSSLSYPHGSTATTTTITPLVTIHSTRVTDHQGDDDIPVSFPLPPLGRTAVIGRAATASTTTTTIPESTRAVTTTKCGTSPSSTHHHDRDDHPDHSHEMENADTKTASNQNNNNNNNNNDDEEMEQEDMFVEPHESFTFRQREWGGPRRGGRLPEPTRYGDWERKGRCTDF